MRAPFLALLALPFLLLSAALVGCDSAGDSTTGTFKVYLTDAPGEFAKAFVTIESVSLHGEGGSITLRNDEFSVDLLTLQNEVAELVGPVDVPEGTYSELRLVISGGYVELKDDGKIYASSDSYPLPEGKSAHGRLQMPSYAQSGLKIKLPGGAVHVDGAQDQQILLDFSVAESFGQQAGASGMWVMTPVIRASDFKLTGGIEVALTLDEEVSLPSDDVTLADFSAELNKGTDPLSATFKDADGDGTFTAVFPYLDPGTYEISLVAPEGVEFTSEKASPISITVASGATAREAVTITAASATEAETEE